MKNSKMRNHFVLLSITAVFFLISNSCVKPEGYGGTSSVSGKILTRYYNDDYSMLIKEVPSVDEDVYLLFGDDESVGDRVFTSSTGAFAFEFLRPGAYTLYFTSEDSTSADRSEEVSAIEFELKSGEDKDLGTLTEFKTLDFNEGTGKIFGVIRLINYKNSSVPPFLEIKDTSFAQEQEVYIRYGTHKFYDERIRTSYNGYFEFTGLIPGEYEVFTYSEDVWFGGTENIPVGDTVIISPEIQEVDLGIMYIEKI